MRAFVLLAQSWKDHRDGTVSLRRAAPDMRVTLSPGRPKARFEVWVMLAPDPEDGACDLRVALIDADGRSVGEPKLWHLGQLQPGDLAYLPRQMEIAAPGLYEVVAWVNGERVAHSRLEAIRG